MREAGWSTARRARPRGYGLSAIIALAMLAPAGQAGPPPLDIRSQIASLSTVEMPGIGFSASLSGAEFLPEPDSATKPVMLLGQAAPARSMLWQEMGTEYDFNRRTTNAPVGVNQSLEKSVTPTAYTISVGDLCFVALGQIVNRRFNAVRYQPSGGLVVNSAASRRLRKAIRAEWGTTTEQSLRASLIRDFSEPDTPVRQIGALQRLFFYFPDELSKVWRAEVAKPTFDVFAVEEFVRSLYPMSPPQRAAAYASFVKANNPAASDGVEQQLFEDLRTEEAREEPRLSPEDAGRGIRARDCLIQLYGRPPGVKAKDRPFPRFGSSAVRTELVAVYQRLAAAHK